MTFNAIQKLILKKTSALCVSFVCVNTIASMFSSAIYSQDFPNQPRMNAIQPGTVHLSEDVLNCDECRRRLGLPPLQRGSSYSASGHSINNALPVPSGTQSHSPLASSLAQSITNPPIQAQTVGPRVQNSTSVPKSMPDNAPVGLSGLPLEARQQLLQGLALPPGATILSAKFKDPEAATTSATNSSTGSSPANNVNDNSGRDSFTRKEESTNAAPVVPRVAVPEAITLAPVVNNKFNLPTTPKVPSEPVVSEPVVSEPVASETKVKSNEIPSTPTATQTQTPTPVIANPTVVAANQDPVQATAMEKAKVDESATLENSSPPKSLSTSSPSDAGVTSDSASTVASPKIVSETIAVTEPVASPTPAVDPMPAADLKPVEDPMPVVNPMPVAESTPVAPPMPVAEPVNDEEPVAIAEPTENESAKTQAPTKTDVADNGTPSQIRVARPPEFATENSTSTNDAPQSAIPPPTPTPAPMAPLDTNSLVVDGVLRSPALQQIQIDLLKKQLLERDELIKQLSNMQPQFQKQIDELLRSNQQLVKRERDLVKEIEESKNTVRESAQKLEMENSKLKSELATVRQQAREQMMLTNDKVADVDRTKFQEISKLSNELKMAQQNKMDALNALRLELSTEFIKSGIDLEKRIADQQSTIATQMKSIAKLERQLESVQASQVLDARRIEKLRKELAIANSEKSNRVEIDNDTKDTDAAKTKSIPETIPAPINQLKDDSVVPKEAIDGIPAITENEEGTKPFQLPVPNTKSRKPRAPRISEPAPAKDAVKEF